MIIKEIEVKNFKSFEHLKLELGKFNVLVGPNAAGKSNFVQVFKFLHDIRTDGLDNAISLQGRDFLTNINIGITKPVSFEFIFDDLGEALYGFGKNTSPMKITKMRYKFELSFTKKVPDFEIIEDNLTLDGSFYRLDEKKRPTKEIISNGQISIFAQNNEVKAAIQGAENTGIAADDVWPPPFRKKQPRTLLIEFPPLFLIDSVEKFAIYNFAPSLAKEGTPITGRAQLDWTGRNLAIVLKDIISDESKRKKMHKILQDFLPFVDELDVDRFADKSLLFKLRETYNKNQYLPAPFISDGTINLTAIIVALFFQENALTIIEEPEKYIHPYLIAKVVEIMKDISAKKQILVTTHSPEVLKHAGLENIYCIARTDKGFSSISKPNEMKNVKVFLQNDMGIDQLFVDNLLGN